MRLVLPRLYVILDSALLKNSTRDCAQELAAAGVRLLQYRNKSASARELLETSRELVSSLESSRTALIVNDRPDVAALAGAKGVPVGEDDLDAEQARAVVGKEMWVGTSTHNLEQFRRATATSADYIAVGPIFATTSKANPDPVVGVELIREVRALTDKPIVAIGGITLERAKAVIDAGADSVAGVVDILLARNRGALLWRTGSAVPARRGTIHLFARGVLAALGLSVRLDVVSGDSDGHDCGRGGRVRAISRGVVPIDFAYDLDCAADCAVLEICDQPFGAATGGRVDYRLSDVSEHARRAAGQTHPEYFYERQGAVPGRADLHLRVRGSQRRGHIGQLNPPLGDSRGATHRTDSEFSARLGADRNSGHRRLRAVRGVRPRSSWVIVFP